MTDLANRAARGLAVHEMIVIGGRSYRRFVHWGAPVRDGTVRCIRCGQIDEPPWHDDEICAAALSGAGGA